MQLFSKKQPLGAVWENIQSDEAHGNLFQVIRHSKNVCKNHIKLHIQKKNVLT